MGHMSNLDTQPLILAFVSDLMFTTRINNVVRHIGFAIEWIEQADELGQPTQKKLRPGESVNGREGNLFTRVTDKQPALLLFDLTNSHIPWQKWIPILKSSPATRRIPIMAFGPHEDVATMQEAKRVGADFVYGRSRFTADMPTLLQNHARIPDTSALTDTCQQPLPDLVVSGIEMFNQGHYYKCHDDLEAAWMADKTPGRNLYRGILQVAIAYYQIERGNYRGAVKMLLRVHQWLDPLPDICRRVNVADLRQNARSVQDALQTLGPDNIADFDKSLFKPVQYAENTA